MNSRRIEGLMWPLGLTNMVVKDSMGLPGWRKRWSLGLLDQKLSRDCQGRGVLAGAGRLNAVHDALAAKGEACLAALNAAMDLGISRVGVEIDSSNLVEALSSNKFDQAPGAVIFKELRMLLALHFVPTNISYVSAFS